VGIFDFLGDLSSKRGKELGLGGLKSLLGTRGAAEAGSRGDEMMKMTGNDSLPGYFNEQTREYVPWYVDLFNGGGLNSAGGVAAKMPAADTGLLGSGPSPRRADIQAQAAPDFQYDYPTEFPPSNPTLPQSQSVDPTEFERFKYKFEKELKANGLWSFPDKIQETLDSLKARGFNY
jgi:hypothetical protein